MLLDFMPRSGIAGLALMLAATAQAQALCKEALAASPPHPAAPPPLAEGFVVPGQVLPGGFDHAHSVEQVLHRRRLQRCREAIAIALAPVDAPMPADNGYVKQTEFDNTPYRFNMTQNGKRMSADDFDAWLQANDYSVGRRVEPGVAQED